MDPTNPTPATRTAPTPASLPGPGRGVTQDQLRQQKQSDMFAGAGAISSAKAAWLSAMDAKGLLSPEKKAWYDAAKKRGLVPVMAPPANNYEPPADGKGVTDIDFGTNQGPLYYDKNSPNKFFDMNTDYVSGVGFSDTSHFLAASNDQERKQILEQGRRAGEWQTYGVDNTDMGQVWWVSVNGKKRSVIGSNPLRDWVASFWGSKFETAGMMAANAIPEFRPLGAVAKMALGSEVKVGLKYIMKRGLTGTVYNGMRAAITGAGAAAGEQVDEQLKKFDGLWAKSTDEQKAGAFHAFLTGAVAEIIPRLAGSFVRTFGSGYAPLLPAEHRAQVRSMIDRGITPGVSQATQGKSILLSFEQAIIEYAIGHPVQQKANFEAIQKEFRKKLMQVGYSEFEADAEMKRVAQSANTKIDTLRPSDELRQSGQTKIIAEQSDVDMEKRGLQRTLDSDFQQIERDIGSPDPATQARVATEIVDSRVKFGKDMRPEYDAAFAEIEKEGGDNFRESASIRAAAEKVWNSLPEDQHHNKIFNNDALGGIMVRLKNLPPFVDTRTLQQLRTQLFQAGAYRDLTPGHSAVQFNTVGEAVDAAMHAGNPKFAKMLDAADAKWEAGIKRFKGLRVKQLAKEAESGILTDPAGMGRLILQKNQAAEAMRIRGLVTPETWSKVAAGYWEHLKSQAKDAFDNLNGKRFSDVLNKQGRLLDIAFGKQKADQMKKYAARYAALGGEEAAKDIGPDNFMTLLHGFEQRRAALDARMKTDFVKMLFEEGPDRRNVIDYMMENPERIGEAKRFYGETSPQWQQLKGEVMKQILTKSVARDASLVESFTKPGQLSGALSKYNDRQLTEMFGADMAADLKKLGKEIDIAGKAPNRSLTGALVVIPLILHPLIHLGEITALAVMSQVLSYPKFVRWLATGLEAKDMRTWEAVAKTAKHMIYMAAPTIANGTPGAISQPQGMRAEQQNGQGGAYTPPDWANVPQ